MAFVALPILYQDDGGVFERDVRLQCVEILRLTSGKSSTSGWPITLEQFCDDPMKHLYGLRVPLTFLICAGRRSAHFRMASSAGHRDCPHDVRLYSTLGGTCA